MVAHPAKIMPGFKCVKPSHVDWDKNLEHKNLVNPDMFELIFEARKKNEKKLSFPFLC